MKYPNSVRSNLQQKTDQSRNILISPFGIWTYDQSGRASSTINFHVFPRKPLEEPPGFRNLFFLGKGSDSEVWADPVSERIFRDLSGIRLRGDLLAAECEFGIHCDVGLDGFFDRLDSIQDPGVGPRKKTWAELLSISWDATRRMRNPARVQDSYLAHSGGLGELGIELADPLIVQEERATLGTRLFCADLPDGAEQFVEFLDACYFLCNSEQQFHLLELFSFIGED